MMKNYALFIAMMPR